MHIEDLTQKMRQNSYDAERIVFQAAALKTPQQLKFTAVHPASCLKNELNKFNLAIKFARRAPTASN